MQVIIRKSLERSNARQSQTREVVIEVRVIYFTFPS